jgi:hypothetical protein
MSDAHAPRGRVIALQALQAALEAPNSPGQGAAYIEAEQRPDYYGDITVNADRRRRQGLDRVRQYP